MCKIYCTECMEPIANSQLSIHGDEGLLGPWVGVSMLEECKGCTNGSYSVQLNVLMDEYVRNCMVSDTEKERLSVVDILEKALLDLKKTIIEW